ncbi:hypothetical protein LCGC14_2714040, partial [marine sediment metagenome]
DASSRPPDVNDPDSAAPENMDDNMPPFPGGDDEED